MTVRLTVGHKSVCRGGLSTECLMASWRGAEERHGGAANDGSAFHRDNSYVHDFVVLNIRMSLRSDLK